MQLKPIKIAEFIGAPSCALISRDEKFAMIGGYGLMLINLDDFLYNTNQNKKQKAISIHLRNKNQKFWIDSMWQDTKSNKDIVHFQSQLTEHCFNFKTKQLMKLNKNSKTKLRELIPA